MSIAQEHIIGVDIGSEYIKIVQTSGGTVKIAGWAPVPEGVVKQSKIESAEVLSAAIQRLKKQYKIPNGKCVLCLSNPDTVIRHLRLPEMNQNQIYENVVSEIAGFLPVSQDKYNIDYRILEVIQGEAAQLQVMVVATPRETVSDYIECLKSAGLTVKYVDIAENSYEKLLRYMKFKKIINSNNFAVIELGTSKNNIIIYKNGVFFLNQMSVTGIMSLRSSLQHELSIDLKTADKLLKSSISAWNGKAAGGAEISVINRHFSGLASDILKVFDFYDGRNRENPITDVYIAGGLSLVPGVGEFLSEQLRLPVSTLSRLSSFMYKKPQTLLKDPFDYSAALGATFREVSKK